MSQRLEQSGFDIEASHSFTLRNFGKEKQSNPYQDSLRMENEGGKESAMSNYSKIQAESYQQKSQRDAQSSARSGKNSPGRLIGHNNSLGGTRNSGKTLSRVRLSKNVHQNSGPYANGSFFKADDESVSQASSKQPRREMSESHTGYIKPQQENENLETLDSVDDRKPGAASTYLTHGAMSSSFSKYRNVHAAAQ